MANHPSAKKRIRQNAKRRTRNQRYLSEIRTRRRAVLEAKGAEERQAAMQQYQSVVDRSAKRHIIHDRTAARMKSRIQAALAKATQS